MKGSDSYKLADFGEAKKFTVDNILTVKYIFFIIIIYFNYTSYIIIIGSYY